MFGSPYTPQNWAFGAEMYKAILDLLDRGQLVPNNIEVLEGGLGAVEKGLQRVQAGVSGVKLVVRPQES